MVVRDTVFIVRFKEVWIFSCDFRWFIFLSSFIMVLFVFESCRYFIMLMLFDKIVYFGFVEIFLFL